MIRMLPCQRVLYSAATKAALSRGISPSRLRDDYFLKNSDEPIQQVEEKLINLESRIETRISNYIEHSKDLTINQEVRRLFRSLQNKTGYISPNPTIRSIDVFSTAQQQQLQHFMDQISSRYITDENIIPPNPDHIPMKENVYEVIEKFRKNKSPDDFRNNDHNYIKFSYNLARNIPLNEIIQSYLELPTPRVASIRRKQLQEFSKKITSGTREITEPETLIEIFEELLLYDYLLTPKEFESYVIVSRLRRSTLDLSYFFNLLDNFERAIGYFEIDYITPILQNIDESSQYSSLIDYLSTKPDSDFLDVQEITYRIRLQQLTNSKDLLNQLNLIEQTSDPVIFAGSRGLHSTITSLLDSGFYTVSKKLLDQLTQLHDLQIGTITESNSSLLKALLDKNIIPNTYFIERLKPNSQTFRPFFKYLSELETSKSEMHRLVNLMIYGNIPFDNYILMSLFQHMRKHPNIWTRPEAFDFIDEFLVLNVRKSDRDDLKVDREVAELFYDSVWEFVKNDKGWSTRVLNFVSRYSSSMK